MKNFVFFQMLLLFLFFSCNKKNEIIEKKEEVQSAIVDNRNMSLEVSVPEKTELKVTDGITYFKLPENYYAIVETASGEKIYVGEGGVKCDCTEGKGGTCIPVKAGNQLGCFQSNGCTTCIATYFRTKGDAQPITIKNISIMLGNIQTAKEDDITREVDLQTTTAFVKDPKLVEQVIIPVNSYSEMRKMKYISEQDLKSDFIDEQIKFIIEGAAKTSKSTEKVLSPISIKGKLAFLVLPRDFVENSSGVFRLYDDEAGLKCSGNCQAGSCVKKNKLGLVVWCDGCSSGCSLSD